MGGVESLDRLRASLDTPELPAYQAILCHASAVVNQGLGYPDQAMQAFKNGLAHWGLAPQEQGLRAASVYFEWLKEEGFDELVGLGEQQYQKGDCPLVDPRLLGSGDDPLVHCVAALHAEDGTTAERLLYETLQQSDSPDRGLALSLLALARYVSGDYAGSREVGDEAAEAGMQRTDALVRVGLHLQLLDREAAAAKLAQLQALDPWTDWAQQMVAEEATGDTVLDWQACMAEGFEQLAAGDLENASQAFARAANGEDGLKIALALNALALVAFRQGKYGESTENQQEALQLWASHQNIEDPAYLFFLNQTAAQDIKLDPLIDPWGREQTEEKFVEGEGWADDMAEGWQALRSRNPVKAGRHFSLAANMVRGPKQALALASLAATSLEMGDYSSADEAYREAGELWKGDSAEAIQSFCSLLQKSGWTALAALLASEQRLLNPWDDLQASPADPVETRQPIEPIPAATSEPEPAAKGRKGWWPFKR